MPSQFSFSSARLCRVQKLQFGILSPDEVVSLLSLSLFAFAFTPHLVSPRFHLECTALVRTWCARYCQYNYTLCPTIVRFTKRRQQIAINYPSGHTVGDVLFIVGPFAHNLHRIGLLQNPRKHVKPPKIIIPSPSSELSWRVHVCPKLATTVWCR